MESVVVPTIATHPATQSLEGDLVLSKAMVVPDQAGIVLVDTHAEVSLLWKGFDGDDSFDEQSIEVLAGGKSSLHEFCGCAVNGLRKVTILLKSTKDGESKSGFRHPDPIVYSPERRKDEMTLSIEDEKGRPFFSID